MKELKRVLVFALFLIMMAVVPIPIFASDDVTSFQTTDKNIKIKTNLNSMDFREPFTQTYFHRDDEGELHIIEMSFEPKSEFGILGSKSQPASVGTWTTSYTGLSTMSYRYDVTKDGSQWKISNEREHKCNAPFSRFSNYKLDITRIKSTSTFPAEIIGSCDYQIFDNQWTGPIYSGTNTLRTTITSGGTLTVHW